MEEPAGFAAGFVAGLDAAPLGRELAPAGLVGAATPDWELYASTTGLVISTVPFCQNTGPLGH